MARPTPGEDAVTRKGGRIGDLFIALLILAILVAATSTAPRSSSHVYCFCKACCTRVAAMPDSNPRTISSSTMYRHWRHGFYDNGFQTMPATTAIEDVRDKYTALLAVHGEICV